MRGTWGPYRPGDRGEVDAAEPARRCQNCGRGLTRGYIVNTRGVRIFNCDACAAGRRPPQPPRES